jgi:hypothetical protein
MAKYSIDSSEIFTDLRKIPDGTFQTLTVPSALVPYSL